MSEEEKYCPMLTTTNYDIDEKGAVKRQRSEFTKCHGSKCMAHSDKAQTNCVLLDKHLREK
jgi:hypothetical protein